MPVESVIPETQFYMAMLHRSITGTDLRKEFNRLCHSLGVKMTPRNIYAAKSTVPACRSAETSNQTERCRREAAALIALLFQAHSSLFGTTVVEKSFESYDTQNLN